MVDRLAKSLCFIILVLSLIHLNDAKHRCLITLKNGREQELKLVKLIFKKKHNLTGLVNTFQRILF